MSQADKDTLIAQAESRGVTVDKRWSAARIQEELDKAPTPAEVAAAASTSPSQPAAGEPPTQNEDADGSVELPDGGTAGEKLVAASNQAGPSQGFALTAENLIAALEDAPHELLARLGVAIADAQAKGPKPGAPGPLSALELAQSIPTINQDKANEFTLASAAAGVGLDEAEASAFTVRQGALHNGQFTGPAYLIVADQSGQKHAVELDD